ncbi:YHS domain-containing protein [Verrucomicrobia bacterium S94]|nr:YHS domain-containing protein [Pontiellaceae bacterium B12219]QBG46101.1 YHS domain-containing protein [Verrucomicrobia bacterium S94]
MKAYLISGLLAAALFMAGLSLADQPTQSTCPVMEGNPIDPSFFVDHEGQRIYFCCKMCVNLFQEAPEKYLANLSVNEELQEQHLSEKVEVHDHATDHQDHSSSSRLITFIGKFHPVAVHIPIGLILMAALAESLFLCFGSHPLFRGAARFNLHLALLGAVAAIILGLAAASGTSYPAEYAEVLMKHKVVAFITLAASIVAACCMEIGIRKERPTFILAYRVSLVLAAVLVALTGHFGGMLVYGLNHFSW